MLRINKILVADRSQYLANLTANMLRAVGAKAVTTATDSAAVLLALHRGAIEALVIDEHLEPIDGVALARQVRADESGQNRLVPIIMTFAEAPRERIEAARDAGVTEFVKKPMSPKILEARLTQAVEHPRGFVEGPAYVGPDRRRRNLALRGEDRRQKDEAGEA